MADDRRARGREAMSDVYGWDVGDDISGDFVEMTVDHLFGEVWTRPGFTIRERRLILLGLLVGLGLDDVAGLQVDAALRQGDLTPDDLREAVIFLAHYAGWPRAAKLNTEVEKLIAKLPSEPASGEGEGESDGGGG